MTNLISGKEALIALANGQEVEVRVKIAGKYGEWFSLKEVEDYKLKDLINNEFNDQFRLKTRTITINNIEVPAPFEPNFGDDVWFLSDDTKTGYKFIMDYEINEGFMIGAWRTEDEIKQVVAALRSIFK